ncbi:MAG: sugar kinase [Pseudomonadota bacterium]
MARITVFGEPLLELASTASGSVLGAAQLGIAGDTLNTSVYLARLGHEVSYVTALGEDTYSQAIVERLNGEGVSTDRIVRHPTRVPGLYAIRTDEAGERFFTYWRDQSAARDFFALAQAPAAIGSAWESDLFYFSGISLAILQPQQRNQLLEVARACRRRGVEVAFDGNYRPYGWQSTDQARGCLTEVGQTASIVLPTSEDDDQLFGPSTPVEHAHRWRSFGAGLVVVKNGPNGAYVVREGVVDPTHVAVEQVIQPVDTTGAGDSFNAAFLAATLGGRSPTEAAAMGNRLAARVIQHRGALIPPSEMPSLA